jgi:hypothetical protein
MYTYSIVALCIIVIIFITIVWKNKEGYSLYEDSSPASISDSQNSYSQMPSTSPLAQSLNSAHKNLEFYTTNNINYNLLDVNIQSIERQFTDMQYRLNNLKFAVGTVSTSGSSSDEPGITIGGNYPDNIQLNFKLSPPKPGIAGKQGIPGEQGISGEQGQKGVRGLIGGNSYS